jgi:predicted nucleic acid-binding protein
MTVYVLDSSALIRYIDNEAGAVRVEQILAACAALRARAVLSAVQWGEVSGNVRKRFGSKKEEQTMTQLLPSEVEIVTVTGERAVRAAALRVDRKIPFADAFAVELTMGSAEHVLVTADYDFKAVEDLIKIEFLPQK